MVINSNISNSVNDLAGLTFMPA